MENGVKRGDHHLAASDEIVSVPAHLSAELRRYSGEGMEGRSHDAGYFDSSFRGDAVFEISPEEAILLDHGTPLSSLDLFWNREIPDKLYGEEIGSSYRDQRGPKTSNHFMGYDFKKAAKNYSKLSRIVLVHD